MAQSGTFTTLRDAVVVRLRSEIVTGSRAPGQPLRDIEVSASFGVSTSPVREAIATLAIERLVELLPNGRKIVSLVDKRRARDFLQIHTIFDLLAIELGLPQLTATDLERMEMHAASMRVAAQACDGIALHRAQIRLYEILYQATGNDVLYRRFWHSLSWLERLVHRLGPADNGHRVSGSEKLLAALRRGDLPAAAIVQRAMAETFRAWIDQTDLIPEISCHP